MGIQKNVVSFLLHLHVPKVDAIFESVRAKVVRGVESAPWMREQTRAAAAEKIRKLRGDFVGSDIYFNQSLMHDRYGNVSFVKKEICLE